MRESEYLSMNISCHRLIKLSMSWNYLVLQDRRRIRDFTCHHMHLKIPDSLFNGPI